MATQLKILLVLIIGCATLSQAAKTDWQYLILTFNWTSTNETILATPLRPIRISPGFYGLSGTVELGVPLDDSFMFEMNILRSPVGSGHFVMTPFHMKKTPARLFLNTFYRQFAMKDVQKCSDFPYSEKLFKEPIPPKTYHMDKCMLESSLMPAFVRQGFYKIVFKVTSPLVELVTELVSQVCEII